MKHTKEEILFALHVIKDECDTNDCEECPFASREGACLIDVECPGEWNINDKEVNKWRGLL